MLETRCECSWCHEIVNVGGARRSPEGACTGQPLHSAHAWIQNRSVVRSRLPFENQRRFSPMAQAPKRAALSASVPVG